MNLMRNLLVTCLAFALGACSTGKISKALNDSVELAGDLRGQYVQQVRTSEGVPLEERIAANSANLLGAAKDANNYAAGREAVVAANTAEIRSALDLTHKLTAIGLNIVSGIAIIDPPEQTVRTVNEGGPSTLISLDNSSNSNSNAVSSSISEAIADGRVTVADGAFQVNSSSSNGPITLSTDVVNELVQNGTFSVNNTNNNTNSNGVTVTNNLAGGMPMCGMPGGPNCPPMGGGD